jgi:GNAT superfamily N-acetyltransferase
MKIALAETDADIARCFPVMNQLRPHLVESDFVPRVRRMMAAENYRLAFLIDDNGTVRAVAGFRPMEKLYSGQTLSLDDLVTDDASRSCGYGDKLFDWLVAHARSRGCDVLHLDSGTQRVDAHRFYLRKRMNISCFHFELPLKSVAAAKISPGKM